MSGRADGDGNAASLRQKTAGFFIGADAPVGGDWRAGLAGGYQRTFVNSDDRGSSGTIDGYHVMAYGGTHQGPLGIGLGASYTFQDISTSRTIVFPGFADATSAHYGGGTAQVFGELSYDLKLQKALLEPFIDLAYVNVHTDGFTETGGAASLTGASDNADTTYSTLGSRAAVPLPVDFDLTATERSAGGMPSARRKLDDPGRLCVRRRYAPSACRARRSPATSALVEAGLVGRVARNQTLGLTYTGQLAEHAQEHALTLEFVDRF